MKPSAERKRWNLHLKLPPFRNEKLAQQVAVFERPATNRALELQKRSEKRFHLDGSRNRTPANNGLRVVSDHGQP